MRTTLDFTPLFHSSIGFERLLQAADASSRMEAIEDWPAYDIAKLNEDGYRISMAVAGFSKDDLTITQEQNMLTVTGHRAVPENLQFLHRGIPDRDFRHSFELADYVEVTGATLANGLLTVDLKREVPEELKPRRIEITADNALPKVEKKQIDAEKQAA